MHGLCLHYRGKKLRHDWRDKLQVGDILQAPSGRLRIVRKVKRHPDDPSYVSHVGMVILKCSWTHRCDTVFNRSDLKTVGFKKVRKKPVKLDSAIDRKIEKDMKQVDKRKCKLTCCDLRGLS